MGEWWGGIGNKTQLRPAKAGAGAWPELGKILFVQQLFRPKVFILVQCTMKLYKIERNDGNFDPKTGRLHLIKRIH